MKMKLIRPFLWVIFVFFSIQCEKTPAPNALSIREEPGIMESKDKELRENTAFELADGLKINLWASDSLAPDPIALAVDNKGNVYLTRTNRQKNSEFDIRGHRNWEIPSIALETVADRRKFLREYFSPENSEQNNWLKDLNNDGSHDWKDLAVEKDEIWKLTDEDGDGYADISTRILEDFNEEITDVAGALLVRDEDIFLGIAPDMWRLKDTNGDGIIDDKQSISHGYAVHIGFSGHGMSGAVEGPDGKIYWGIGDIGANVTDAEGKQHKYPNQGVLVRANPDGSDFEVFAAGLRNTHEFVFDKYGNIIGADNDGDHPGESERLVHIVEGSDAGWRANWQYGKYNDPKNNDYKVWMDEELFKPRWEGQAAYIIPPIMNYHNGPTGMQYNPGSALGKKWQDHFFLVEFVGNPSRSPIWAFTLKPEGASFDLEQEQVAMKGILPTGIEFGPDGALYIADWVNGWGTKNYGRVWKLDVDEQSNDLAKKRAETKTLMVLDYSEQESQKLYELLSYSDMRIRQKAQFELAKRNDKATLLKAIAESKNQLARIHGIWGIGQIAAKDQSAASELVPYLQDQDPEIIAQTAKVLGDLKYNAAGDSYISLLQNPNPRVKFYAAQAIGRIAYEPAIDALLQMLEVNNDQDLYLRHAAVFALSRIGKAEPIIALATSDSRALRIAAVLVLRRMQHEKVSLFLNDADEYIVTEAARAINDDWSIEPALPALAATLAQTRFTSEPLIRRAINACLRVGTEKEIDLLLSYALRNDANDTLRAEALATLGTWTNPSVMDRVDGRYRGEINREPALISSKVNEQIDKLLGSQKELVLIASAEMLQNLNINSQNERLATIFKTSRKPAVRAAMLPVLTDLNYQGIVELIQSGMEDNSNEVRTAAISLLDQLDISRKNLPSIVAPVFAKGSLQEKQSLLSILGEMPLEKTAPVLSGLADQLIANSISPDIILDVKEAIAATESEELKAKLAQVNTSNEISVENFKETLYGGDLRSGRRYFYRSTAGQCTRCHAIGGRGGEVGPDLANIGNILTREELLEALILPSNRLAPGYGMVSLTLNDGQTVNGTLMHEDEEFITLKTSEAEPMEVEVSRVSKRQNIPSSMPPMATIMSRREIRDMVEYLSSLKNES